MLWLIFLPVLLLGAALLALAGWRVAQHLNALTWEPVTALSGGTRMDGEKHPAFTGSDRLGGTQRVAGRFSYTWQGQHYISDRLAFFSARSRERGGSGPGIDDWDARLAATVGEPGASFTAWVNPRDPSQAVAVRDIRWLELGAMIGAGFLFFWAGWQFLFALPGPVQPPAFSWRTVGIFGTAGIYLGVLAPLLWRDGHPVWAAFATLPALLALYGTIHGLRQ